jgi:phosphoribosylformylglycinamidine cyclo-ligase
MPTRPKIFQLIQKTGRIAEDEMYKTFNMGIGFVIVCPPDGVEKTVRIFRKYKMDSMQIGDVENRPGVWLGNNDLA